MYMLLFPMPLQRQSGADLASILFGSVLHPILFQSLVYIDLVVTLLVYTSVRQIAAFITQNKFKSFAPAHLYCFFINLKDTFHSKCTN